MISKKFQFNSLFCFLLKDESSNINVVFGDFPSEKDVTEVEIDSFDTSINYTLRIEAVPMNNLTVNGEVVERQVACEKNETSMSWLNCLQSVGQNFTPKKCQNLAEFKFSYTFENAKEYESQNIKAKQFNHVVNLSCNISF